MTMTVTRTITNPTDRDIKDAVRRLNSVLRRSFPRHGNQGAGTGIFSEIGRGDGSLHDSFREAEPDDELEHYHDELNGMQPLTGPFYVHTRANRFEQRGILIPDMPASRQMGSPQAIYTRQEVAMITTKILMGLMHWRGQLPGLMFPGTDRGLQIALPGSPEKGLLRKLEAAERTKQKKGLKLCLESMSKLSANLEGAVVVSDFMSSGWETKLRNIGRKLELLAFQIIDPTDIELPEFRRRRAMNQGGKTVIVNGSNNRKRRNYRNLSAAKQVEIAQAIKSAGGQHHKLTTDRPLLDQLEEICSSPSFQRRNLR